VSFALFLSAQMQLTWQQFFLPIYRHNRLHTVPARHCRPSLLLGPLHDRTHSDLYCSGRMVTCCRRQYPGWIRCGEKSRRHRSISSLCILRGAGSIMLYHLIANSRDMGSSASWRKVKTG
jgi:hypothetical protein